MFVHVYQDSHECTMLTISLPYKSLHMRDLWSMQKEKALNDLEVIISSHQNLVLSLKY